MANNNNNHSNKTPAEIDKSPNKKQKTNRTKTIYKRLFLFKHKKLPHVYEKKVPDCWYHAKIRHQIITIRKLNIKSIYPKKWRGQNTTSGKSEWGREWANTHSCILFCTINFDPIENVRLNSDCQCYTLMLGAMVACRLDPNAFDFVVVAVCVCVRTIFVYTISKINWISR